jgi:hypothetical protein
MRATGTLWSPRLGLRLTVAAGEAAVTADVLRVITGWLTAGSPRRPSPQRRSGERATDRLRRLAGTYASRCGTLVRRPTAIPVAGMGDVVAGVLQAGRPWIGSPTSRSAPVACPRRTPTPSSPCWETIHCNGRPRTRGTAAVTRRSPGRTSPDTSSVHESSAIPVSTGIGTNRLFSNFQT